MKDIIQWVKRTALFLLGVGLIVWGYRVNAGNNKPVEPVLEPVKRDRPDEEKGKSAEPKPESVREEAAEKKNATKASPGEEKEKTSQPGVKKPAKPTADTVKTVVETAKKAEESSGTE